MLDDPGRLGKTGSSRFKLGLRHRRTVLRRCLTPKVSVDLVKRGLQFAGCRGVTPKIAVQWRNGSQTAERAKFYRYLAVMAAADAFAESRTCARVGQRRRLSQEGGRCFAVCGQESADRLETMCRPGFR